ncbi:hypothetical protein ES703_117404 [subsurface metagenome]
MPCGIGGISSFRPLTERDAVTAHRLLTSLTRRGEDAWGYFDGVRTYKEPGSVLDSPKYDTLIDDILESGTDLFLCHTRLATLGDSEQNQNNHPFDLGPFIFAHNGMLFRTDPFDNPTDIETDSYWMLWWINEEYKRYGRTPISIQKGVEHVVGNYACWLHNQGERKTYLIRNAERLVGTYFVPEEGRVIFGSDWLSLADALAVPKGLRTKEWAEEKFIPVRPFTIYEISEGGIASVAGIRPPVLPRPREGWRFWRWFGHLRKYVEAF